MKKEKVNTSSLKDIKPKLDTAILQFDRTQLAYDQRLDTGMKVGEAVDRAALWWETTGRKLARDKNNAADNPGFGSFTPDPQTPEQALNSYPSGIMAGKPWSDLTRDEKLRVTRAWHHHHVRAQIIDPECYLREKKMPGTCFYCHEPSVAWEDLPGESREMCVEHWKHRYPREYAEHMKSLETAAREQDN